MGSYSPASGGGAIPDPLVLGTIQATNTLTSAAASLGNNALSVTNTGRVGFYEVPAIPQQAGVPITAAGIHAALVNLGLIT